MTAPAAGRAVKIRMYNVGFGDSFLLTFPADDGDRLVLVDCGRHFASRGGRPIDQVVATILDDVTRDGRAHLDLVIATHRHQDHISGFADERWKTVDVGEVWLPWTEHPKDPEARRIRDAQTNAARRLQAACERLPAAAAAPALELARNSATNAAAIETLRRGFAGRPRRLYLPTEERAEATFQPQTLPGVVVHVLGPSRDPDVIRDLNPPPAESYLALLRETSPSERERRSPFGRIWTVGRDEFAAEGHYPELTMTDTEIEAVDGLGSSDPFALAVALERAVNGTSLMLVFELGEALFLFPGDAQWGTWKAALDDPEWRLLLERTTFYKVGHHGSHNGTPKTFVRQVLGATDETTATLGGFSAMVSTETIPMWPKIPKPELLADLGKRTTRLGRTDRTAQPDGFRVGPQGLYVETTITV